MKFINSEKEDALKQFGIVKIIRVAVVQQEPFVFWNNETGLFLCSSAGWLFPR